MKQVFTKEIHGFRFESTGFPAIFEVVFSRNGYEIIHREFSQTL